MADDNADDDLHSIAVLFTYTFGVASLSMGHVFASTGPLMGSILLYLLSASNLHASALLAKCMSLAPPSVRTYGDLGLHACGPLGQYIILISESLSCLLTPIAFLVLGGTELLPSIAQYIHAPWLEFSSTAWILLLATAMLPIVFLPSLKETFALCVLGGLATFFADSAALYVNLTLHPMAPRATAVTFSGVLSAYGTIMFAFGTALLVPPLHRQRRDKDVGRFVLVLSATLIAITCLYIGIGSATYFQLGCTAPATLLESMPRGLAKTLATSAMLLHIMVAYPVILTPTLFVIERKVFGKDSDATGVLLASEDSIALLGQSAPLSPVRNDGDMTSTHVYKPVDEEATMASELVVFTKREIACRFVLRTLIVAGQCFVAVMLQGSFADILSLIGATTVTLPCMIMPCVCYLRMVPHDGSYLSGCTRAFTLVVILSSALLSVYATIHAIGNIHNTMATFHLFAPVHHREFVNGAEKFPFCQAGERN
ncbi:hypothetical protein SPRG_02916 [Saprolegnia parasitica CBS 223.65]|uniref:Amino acid transporter transmembrane domain-containing protein n=1 Tax=Saprolegnia parasitica (strain CBS 223.65) TaxID=695850 RepID=A0A067CP02_SAPPC|nr:hypothetical protein SPRG_02916 [Saprolegnia parasitica CBS 223.65]KDO32439.1 hypothetical protein SPRG_02916 [Saprolegnia parasitica CBS 223.65]|eukprot:XP_012196890.1 hypothetical protein SPRG_02916 [Saprolegnia parasitica CBS 223.65]